MGVSGSNIKEGTVVPVKASRASISRTRPLTLRLARSSSASTDAWSWLEPLLAPPAGLGAVWSGSFRLLLEPVAVEDVVKPWPAPT